MPIGPRFANSVLQTLLVLLKKEPPKNHRLLILATTSQRHVLEQMDLSETFSTQVYVPAITDLRYVDFVVNVSIMKYFFRSITHPSNYDACFVYRN